VKNTKCLGNIAATIDEDELDLEAPFLPKNRYQESSIKCAKQKKREKRDKRERENGCSLAVLCSNERREKS
jgi:hypothetical protein